MAARVTRPKAGDDVETVETPDVETEEVMAIDLPPEEAVDPPPEPVDPSSEDEEEELEDGSLSLETADPEQILWEGGPTVEEALEFKTRYGEIYVTTISLSLGKFILWKTLNRTEYRNIMRHVEELNASGVVTPGDAAMTQEELIAEACILVPQMTVDDFAGDLAGIPSLLAQQILEASGFVAIDTRGL